MDSSGMMVYLYIIVRHVSYNTPNIFIENVYRCSNICTSLRISFYLLSKFLVIEERAEGG